MWCGLNSFEFGNNYVKKNYNYQIKSKVEKINKSVELAETTLSNKKNNRERVVKTL